MWEVAAHLCIWCNELEASVICSLTKVTDLEGRGAELSFMPCKV